MPVDQLALDLLLTDQLQLIPVMWQFSRLTSKLQIFRL
jgi:hypothetical protein